MVAVLIEVKITRDVPRLYPILAGYPATFHYPVPVPDSQDWLKKQENETG